MAVGPREWSPRATKVHFFKVEELAAGTLSKGLQQYVARMVPDFVDAIGGRFYMIEEVIAAADDSGIQGLVDEAQRFYDRAVETMPEMIGKPLYVKLDKE